MPVACLCGFGPEALTGLARMPGGGPALHPSQIRQIGIRSVDAGEKRFVHEQGLEVFDMRAIDEVGMRQTMQQALAGLDAHTHLHVSFDVDFLDPDIAPGVGTTVPGGPTYREAQLCMEMIADSGRLASLDIVELNPALDVRNRTAVLAVDLVESLFGKSTLMRSSPQNSAKRPWPGVPPQAVRLVRQGEATTPGEFCELLLALGRREPAHELLHQVGPHVAVEQRLFGLLGQRNGFVVADVALLQQLGVRDQLHAGGRAQAELDAQAQLQFAHLSRRVEAHHHTLLLLLQQIEDGLCRRHAGRVAQQFELAARSVECALQLTRQRRAGRGRDVELYKTEKINPLGGCLPIVVQIPVFISLYWVLLASVEMRNAPWLGWIHDLSAPDTLFGRAHRIAAYLDGHFDVHPDQAQSNATGSDSGKSDDVHAADLIADVLLVPGRHHAVLGREQRAVNHAAMVHHQAVRASESISGAFSASPLKVRGCGHGLLFGPDKMTSLGIGVASSLGSER
eukprot:gene17828-24898_t